MSNITSLRLAEPLEVDSVVNGEGLRAVLWFQGCLFACKGCHNPNTWPIDAGNVYWIKDIINEIKKHDYLDGVTLSGGDPIFQIEALKILLPEIKKIGLNVWLYSGDTYENLIKDQDFLQIAKYIDVLVDGPFVLSLLDLNLNYRGSTNQRIIDLKKSLLNEDVILYQSK